ncbi:MAG: hypothetical protein IJL64_00770 [Bacteroidales bacterium]|nr:hypothetical protein [Bacteroidales bacterium]
MKHRSCIISVVLAVSLLLPAICRAEGPTATYDGRTLTISVPSGRLGFSRAAISGCAPVCEAFAWNQDSTCLFMPGTYTFPIERLSDHNGEIFLDCTFNDAEHQLCIAVRLKPAGTDDSTSPEEDPAAAGTPGKEGKGFVTMQNIIIALLLCAIAILVLMVRKKKTGQRFWFRKKQTDDDVFTVIEDTSEHYAKGLQHVLSHPEEYLTFDLNEVFENTGINRMYFSIDLVKKVYSFFNRSLENGERTNETGCYLVGCWDYAEGSQDRFDISVEYMVEPGDDADFGEYSLNFGKKIGVSMGSLINSLASKTGRDYVLTGWIHSHPGLGLFLSNQDLIVQRQLVYTGFANRLIALVIDTNSMELQLGCFTPQTDGRMNNKDDVRKWFSFEEMYKQARQAERERNRQPVTADDEQSAENPHYMKIPVESGNLCGISLSGKAINQINDLIYNSSEGVIGYFSGHKISRTLFVENCLSYSNGDTVGCLVVHTTAGTDAIATAYASQLSGKLFYIVYRTDEELDICIPPEDGVKAVVTMNQMKEWLRRKRN